MAGERQRDEVEVHLEAAELCAPRRVGVLARQTFPDLALVAATGPFYRMELWQAGRVIQELHEVVCKWRRRARAIELPA